MKKLVTGILSTLLVCMCLLAITACNPSQENDNTCTVIFNTMDGSENQVTTVSKGEKVSAPEIRSRNGYTFKGWYISTEFTSDGEWSFIGYSVTEDMTLYAYWIPNEYSITYKEIGGIVFSSDNDGILPTKHTYDTQTNLPTPTKDGYIFIGWFLDYNGASSPITSLIAKEYASEITLYAKWVKERYNIEYKDCGGTAFSGDNKSSLPIIHSYGNQTNLPDGTKMGYNFLGWYLDIDCDSEKITSIKAESLTEDIILYAKWEGNITYIDEKGNTQTFTSAPIKVLKAGQLNSLNNISKISGWYLFSGNQQNQFHDIEVDGTANIILEDGCDCSLSDLIVNENSILYIYSQSFSDVMGKLTINSNLGGQTGSSIKLASSGGTIVICGGYIVANSIGGGDAGSYGGNGGDSGNITIYNGVIETMRIGGGNGSNGLSANYFNTSNQKGGNGGNGGSINTITIYGGSLVAETFGGGNGGDGGSASGASSGGNGGDGGNGGSLIIYGGYISLNVICGGNGGDGGRGGTPKAGLGGSGGNGGKGAKGTNIVINSADTSVIFANAIQLVGGSGGNGGDGGYGSGFNTDGKGGNGGDSASGGTVTINGEDTVDYTIKDGNIGIGGSGKTNGSDGVLV